MMRIAECGIRNAESQAASRAARTRDRYALAFSRVPSPQPPIIPQSAIRNPQSKHAAALPSRTAMTLIELLIVIVILSVLTAAALPVLTPSTTERRIREASRELNTYLAQAQSKAIATQRPYGVALKRLSSDTGRAEDRGVCLEVFMVEQPVPYAGFDENSRVRVALNSDNLGGYTFPTVLLQFVTRGNAGADQLPPGWDRDLIPDGVLQVCDVVEVDGNRYELLGANSGSANGLTILPRVRPDSTFYRGFNGLDPQRYVVVARPLNNTGQVLNPVAENQGLPADPQTGLRLGEGWILAAAQGTTNIAPEPPYWTQPSPYKVLRQPTTTSAPPLQLPEAIAIDLEASGIVGETPFHYDDQTSSFVPGETPVDTPIFILFSPEGSIERVQSTQFANRTPVCMISRPSSNVSLLVGRRELIPAQPLDLSILSSGNEAQREEEKNKVNWLNMESRWVTIGAQTGSVVTTENAFVNPLSVTVVDYDRDGDTDQLDTRMGQILAAQEFAREMRRLGGR